jgi:hypothetical protein
MKCPFCGHLEDKVVDSRESREGDVIRRRRECLKCERRFTSYERIDEIPYMVIKKDGRREPFSRDKVMAGLLRACEKRPVPVSKLEAIANAVRILCAIFDRARAFDFKDRRDDYAQAQRAGQSGLCQIRFGLYGVSGRVGVHG